MHSGSARSELIIIDWFGWWICQHIPFFRLDWYGVAALCPRVHRTDAKHKAALFLDDPTGWQRTAL